MKNTNNPQIKVIDLTPQQTLNIVWAMFLHHRNKANFYKLTTLICVVALLIVAVL